MTKFKKGDRVRITAAEDTWWFKVGDVGTYRHEGAVDIDASSCNPALVGDDAIALVTTEKTKALQTQVGGSHYTDMTIQPIEYILANNIPFPEGNVIKYVSRWRAKGGIKDVKKALHHLQLLIEHEESKGTK